jgi:hypothetical protein
VSLRRYARRVVSNAVIFSGRECSGALLDAKCRQLARALECVGIRGDLPEAKTLAVCVGTLRHVLNRYFALRDQQQDTTVKVPFCERVEPALPYLAAYYDRWFYGQPRLETLAFARDTRLMVDIICTHRHGADGASPKV